MTPAQCKEARRLLGWTQAVLARKLAVYQGHISAFERTGKLSRASYGKHDRLAELRATFEAAGVEFASGDQPGVKLRKAEP